MSELQQVPRTGGVTRRDMLKLIGAAGVVVAGVAAVPRTAFADGGNALADAEAATTPEEFLAHAFAARADAAGSGQSGYVSALYDPANASLVRFERERTNYLNKLGSEWNGQVTSFASDLEILGLRRSGNVVTAQLVDTTEVLWTPAPRVRTAAELAVRAKDPQHFGVAAASPSPVVSSCGVRHEVVLVRAGSSWRFGSDSYDELGFLGAAPDLVAGSWADPRSPAASGGVVSSMAAAPAGTIHSYNSMGAVNYALAHAASGTYNTAYCNWNSPCGGGDCANFVSQSLYNGAGYVPDTSWRCFQGSCCGVTRTSATDTWVNNLYLRNWLISSGRAASASGIGSLGYGDTINYNFGSGWAHIAILTDPVNDLICAHNTDHRNFPWSLGASSWLFTSLYATYYG